MGIRGEGKFSPYKKWSAKRLAMLKGEAQKCFEEVSIEYS